MKNASIWNAGGLSASDMLPATRGSYVLWWYLPKRTLITIGRLGQWPFQRGWYGYCGSACGPGGLRARLSHHLQSSRRCHWHIDYVKPHAHLREIWLGEGENHEHDCCRLLVAAGASIPVPGFGSSDCTCVSHFVMFSRRDQARKASRLSAQTTGLRRLVLPLSHKSGFED